MRAKFAASVAALLLVAATAAAQTKPNFAGTWVLDASKSEGVPQGVEETMAVTHDGDKFVVESKMKSPRGERTVNMDFAADGKEGDFTLRMMQNEVKGKRTAKWSADGAALEITETADGVPTPDGGTANIKNWRKWTLSSDGKTLTAEETRTTPRGEQKSKRVYTKQ
ncbi:MAG TPA: hypothetical protein VK421_13150 [Pyrinomonadaceae bacterium]|nr:hypothetical protein [Pyrinomonadaceae bacterium]